MINPLAYLTSPEGSRNTHAKRKVIGQRHMQAVAKIKRIYGANIVILFKSIPKELKNLLPFKVIIK